MKIQPFGENLTMFTLLINSPFLYRPTGQARLPRWSIYGLICTLLLVVSIRTSSAECDGATQTSVIPLSYQLVTRHPHRDSVFTEGLLIEKGILYESGGLKGQSSLTKMLLANVDRVKLSALTELADDLFAEGIAIAGEQIVQLTYKANRALVYNKANLALLDNINWTYAGEGWGLTYDGKNFVMSNGTPQLVWRDTKNFETVKTVTVCMHGEELKNLNELEWIGGYVWANVWHQKFIVVISPETGTVVAKLDLSDITAENNISGEKVLNGIAYDSLTGHIWVTGKLWKTLYELDVDFSVLLGTPVLH